MNIDTEVPGQPGAIREAGRWLSVTLGAQIDGGIDTMLTCRTAAEGDWEGKTGDAFAACMTRGATKAEALYDDAVRVGEALATYAEQLRLAQQAMKEIRSAAREAGLEVCGYVILWPGLGPHFPGVPPIEPVAPAVRKHFHATQERYQLHQLKVDAYENAAAACAEVRERLVLRQLVLFGEAEGLSAADWLFTAASIAVGLREAARHYNAHALRGTAKQLRRPAIDQVLRSRAGTPLPGKASQFYKGLDGAEKALKGVKDLETKADALDRAAKVTALKGSGVLAGAGVAYEIANGKDPVQATASGGAGFAASALTAAAAGATGGSIVPGVGTAVGTAAGAIVGAGLGLMASNAVDSQFEDHSGAHKPKLGGKSGDQQGAPNSGGNSW